jgi:hypothetical protein
MAARPQIDLDAEAFEAKQFSELEKKGGAGAELVASRKIMRKRDEALYAQLLINCKVSNPNEVGAIAEAHERFNAVLEARRRESKARLINLAKITSGAALVIAILVCREQGEGIWYGSAIRLCHA